MFRLCLASIAVISVASAGCTSGGQATSTTSSSTTTLPSITTTTAAPRPSVNVGVPDADYDFNPFTNHDSISQRIVGNAVWATVYDIDPDTWERIPDVVLALPSQAQGGIDLHDDGSMTVQYQVHPDARWSDGIRMTGADITFTAETMRDLALAGNPAVDPIMATVTGVDSLQNIGWITFSERSLAFEEAFWVLLPSHALDDIDIGTSNGFGWPSGGPFVGLPGSNGSELEPNPFYWKVNDRGQNLPLIESLRFVPFLDDLSGMFNAGEIDVADLDGPPADTSIDQSASGVEIQEVPTPVLEHLTFNFRDSREASNPESLNSLDAFRTAIARSVDPSIFLGNDFIFYDNGPPGVLTPRDGSAFAAYEFDSARARSEISELEVVNPSSVINTTGNGELRIEVAEALVPSFAASGVDLTTDFVDSVVFFGDVLPGSTFDIGMWAWISDGGYRSTMTLLETFDPQGATGGYNGWGQGQAATSGSARFSEIVEQARTVTSTSRFKELVAEAEAILADEVPILPLFQRASYAAVWSDHLQGVSHNSTRATFTWNIEEWEATPR